MPDRKLQAALWCLLRDKDFVRHNHTLVNAEAIPRGPLRWIVATSLEEWRKHQSLLVPMTMSIRLSETNLEAWGTSEDEAGDLYADLYTSWEYDPDSIKSLRHIALNWFKQQASGQILDEATEALEGGRVDQAQRALKKASRALADPHRPGLRMADLLRLPPERPSVPTGFEYFDRKWRGGVHHGQLATILAPSNTGKSIFLPYITAAALKGQRGVVYYTTELSDVEVMRRIASAISGKSWVSLNDPIELERIVNDIEQVMFLRGQQAAGEEAQGAFLEVRYRDPGGMSIPEIDADLDELQEQGHHVNLVILDGDDLIDPKNQFEKLYDLFMHVYAQLSQLAVKRDIAIWTAAQGTRQSFKREILDAQDIGDSIWKMRKADLFLAVNMLKNNLAEDGRPVATFSVIKDRHYGTRGKIARYVTEFGNDQTKAIPRYTWWERPDEGDGFTEDK